MASSVPGPQKSPELRRQNAPEADSRPRSVKKRRPATVITFTCDTKPPDLRHRANDGHPNRGHSRFSNASCPAPTGHLPSYLPAVCKENRPYSAFQLYIQIGCGVLNVGQMAAGGNGRHFLGAPMAPGKWLSIAAPLRIEGLRCLVTKHTMAGAPRIARRLPCNQDLCRVGVKH